VPEENSFWTVLIWTVPSNFWKERSRIGWELNVPVAWWPVKEPGVMLPAPCYSARVPGGTVLALSNCVTVGCTLGRSSVSLAHAKAARLAWEPPSVASSAVRCTSARGAAAMRGLVWLSGGSREPTAARWPMGRVCG